MFFQRKSINICGTETTIFGYDWDPFFKGLGATWDGNRSLRNCLIESVDDGSVIVDVGANIGTTAMLMSRIVPQSRIIAIEPTPAGFACLKENVEANKLSNCTIIQAAAGDHLGTTLFHQSNYIAGSHIVTSEHPTIREEAHAIKVDICTIDSIVERESLERVDFIKIDVEGFEPGVLRGAERTIEKFNPIVFVEFNAFTLCAFGEGSPREFLKYLRAKFSVLAYDKGEERILIRTDTDALGFLHYNMTQAGCVSDLICAHDRAILLPDRSKAIRHIDRLDSELLALRHSADKREFAHEAEMLALQRSTDGRELAHAAEKGRADEFEKSLSWRVTKPLRKLSSVVRKRT